MPDITWATYLILCPMLFLAALVDSAAGGGGLISIPAYLFAGFPVHYAYGTNKFTAGSSALFSSVRYLRYGKVALRPTLIGCAGAVLGSWAGTLLALHLSDYALRVILLAALPAAGAFLLITQRRPRRETRRREPLSAHVLCLLSAAIGLVIGGYDGFFGPGSGTFLILALSGLLGLELVTACGSARVINLAANLASLFTFIAGGRVVWMVALPCVACSILGGQLGTRLAVKRGAGVVQPLIIVVVALLFAKILMELLQK